MRLAWGLVLVCALAPSGAAAASFDCRKASSPVEWQICADPKLSAADDEVAALYKRALAATPRPMTLRLDQREWLGDRRAGSDLLPRYTDRISELRRAIADAEKVRKPFPIADVGRRCVPAAGDYFKLCKVLKSGRLQTPGGPLLWQIQELDPTDQFGMHFSMAQAVVLLRPGPGGQAMPVIWKAEDQTTLYDPELVKSPYGLLLVLGGNEQAQAVEDMGSVYRYDAPRWTELDTTSWRASFSKHLPDHRLGLGEGVRIDYASFTASTPLWRPGEPSHFPTGGAAKIRFKLAGNVLAVESVDARLGKAAALKETGQ